MWVFVQEHLGIHMLLHFSDRQALPTCLLLGSEGFISLVPIPQLQQTVITKETLSGRAFTMEEAVKQLTALISTGPDWPYALVRLNRDACHMPLPREGHLSVLVEGGTSSAACGRVSQLEVCQLLSLSSQVIYLVGLDGCEVSVIASLPKSLAKGTNPLGGKPIYLNVDMPQSIAEGPNLKALPPGSHTSSILIASPVRGPPPKAEAEVSMTIEVRELLSKVGLDTSGHISTPKRLEHMVLVTPPPTKLEDFPWPVDTSSQVSTPDEAEMGDTSLEETLTASSLTAETPGPNSGQMQSISGKRSTRP